MPTNAYRNLPLVAAAFMVTIGAAILAGGHDRFSDRSYSAAITLAPHWVWGCWILAAGLVMVAGLGTRRPRVRVFGYWGGAVWSWFFAVSFALSAYRNPFAGLTGMIAYAFIGAVFVGFARAARHKGEVAAQRALAVRLMRLSDRRRTGRN